ncbi:MULTISPECIES: YopX family protein [Lysinibacillus]|uniref:YopX family protein n=1 Tax=Lysinibacillus capsici TaxID=2115968 RepID=A0ABY8KNZ1_9BACI|nr:YopX family protein [Lysinibacillus capsici]WGF40278.1 YopX family protein [Lysinibacillus capsici]
MSREIKFRAWDAKKMKIRAGCKGFYKQNGYVLAKAPYHPYANKRGYVPLHRLVMENYLGRYLTPRKELVHHIDGDRSNNNIQNLKLTTPSEHYIEEHFKARNPNGQFVAEEEIFSEMKFRLYDRDKNIVQIYTLKELMSKTYRRAKFKFRGRWTGLKDKYGKEIYEGDILELYIPNWADCDDVQRFVINEYCPDVSYLQAVVKHCEECLLDGENDYIEVVGNIYENPELLEVTA